MRAIGFYKTGGPEVLQPIEVADPIPSENEITIRMKHTSVNNLDILMRSGATKVNFKLPHITGTDISGTVEKVGSNVRDIAVGERVVSSTIYGCNLCSSCKAGNEVLCPEWKVPGFHSWGSYGELVRVPAALAIRPPSVFSDEELGCMPLPLSISWRALRVAANAKAEETIVIRGASGNAGIFSTLLAKAMGLKVIALTRSPQKKENLSKIGADHVLDYEGDGYTAANQVKELTGGNGADIVLDPLGSTLADSVSMLRHGGRAVVFGTSAGNESNLTIKNFYWKTATIFGVHNATKEELSDALEFASKKNIKPVIATRMNMKEAARAHRLFEESSQFGKILMTHQW